MEPLAESMDEYPLMKELATRLNVNEPWVHVDPWLDMAENFRDAFTEGSFDELLQGKTLQLRYKPMDEYQTKTGKIEFTSTSPPPGVNKLPTQLETSREPDEFIMLNSSIPQYTHTQFTDVYDEIPCTVWVNPEDATKYNLTDGKKHLIYNEQGELTVTIKVTKKVLPGVIWAPRELIDEKGNIQNSLAPGTPQLIGGGPMFNTVMVRFKE